MPRKRSPKMTDIRHKLKSIIFNFSNRNPSRTQPMAWFSTSPIFIYFSTRCCLRANSMRGKKNISNVRSWAIVLSEMLDEKIPRIAVMKNHKRVHTRKQISHDNNNKFLICVYLCLCASRPLRELPVFFHYLIKWRQSMRRVIKKLLKFFS